MEQDELHHDFQFDREIQKGQNYELLIPSREQGFIIFHLYEKIQQEEFGKDGYFTEENINQAVEEIRGAGQRVPHEKNAQMIQDLQEFFLWRDSSTKKYKFKEYANEFCKLVKTRLERQFNPTRIERILNSLIISLEKLVDQFKEDQQNQTRSLQDIIKSFDYWIDEQFSVHRYDIRSQIEVLDQEVDTSVKKLKQQVQGDRENTVQYYRQISESLDQIERQAKELGGVFESSFEIKRILKKFYAFPQFEDFNEGMQKIQLFFKTIKEDLKLVDSRLNRIRSWVNQLFSNLNKPEFNRKTETFLSYLLRESTSSLKGQKVLVQFPADVPLKCLYYEHPKFVMVERVDLFSLQSSPIQEHKIDQEVLDQQYREVQEKLQRKHKIAKWAKKIDDDYHRLGMLCLDQYFFDILKEENDSFYISIRVMSAVLRKFSKYPRCSITVEKELARDPQYPKSAIWKIKVQKIKNPK